MMFVTASITTVAAQTNSSPRPISRNAGSMWTSGDVLGQNYMTKVSLSDVTNAPVWATNQDNPPLSMRQAERLATKALAKTLGNVTGWERADQIFVLWEYPGSLGQGYWIYEFQFRGPTYQNSNGSTSQSSLTFFVMMSGKVVGPEPWKPK